MIARLALLNTSILTAFGTYRYESLSLEQAKKLICEFKQANKPIESAIGHQPTANLLEALLEFPVPKNRIEFRQGVDDLALVFKL
ncbi:MAG: STIV orfB116 family protein, partial [Pyrinomonadaceae bacterium]